MQRSKDNVVDEGKPVNRIAVGLFKKLPFVWEHLTVEVFEDGVPRERSTLSVFYEDGGVKVALNDREEKRSVYFTGGSLEDALATLEAALANCVASWRLWGVKTKRKG